MERERNGVTQFPVVVVHLLAEGPGVQDKGGKVVYRVMGTGGDADAVAVGFHPLVYCGPNGGHSRQ